MMKSKKRSLPTLLFLAAFLLLTPGSSLADRFKITRVYDGDTVMARQDRTIIYIMLIGIDAPEVPNPIDPQGQPYGQEAKDFLTRMVLNKTVKVKGYGRAPYPDNNILGVIYWNQKNINLEMIKQGLAEAHQEGLPEDFDISPYVEAEEEAREKEKGMWRLKEDYMSPRVWRKKHLVR